MAWPVVAAMAAGALANLYAADKQSEATKQATEAERQARLAAQAALTEQKNQLTGDNGDYAQLQKDIEDYYKNRVGLGTTDDVANYRSSITGYNPNNYVYDFDEFKDHWNKTKEDYLNPYYNKIINDTAIRAQGSAAGAGMGRSTFAAQNIARAVAQKEDELYKTALNEYNTDRSQAYKEYADAIVRNQEKLNALREGNQYKMGLQGNLAKDYISTQDAQQSDLMNLKQDKLNAKQQYDMAITGLY
jgi:type II secretory pathway pseudopilin PulG